MLNNNQIQRITTKAIIYRDGKILFVKDSKGKWELPGGKIDFGEKPEDTLKRELNEELGFNEVKVGGIVHAWTFSVESGGADYQFVLLNYECFTDEEEIKCSDEHVEYKWVLLDEVNDLDMRDGYKDTIKKYRELKNL
ncbi:MAG: NUDIX hydrolase [Parcubacteria group bacterium]|nr:NUDIX hydrolase [Parcubacteria group bacterium]MCR4343077.1 NUDIX hydrolase [Patescibacteria group bacterium]